MNIPEGRYTARATSGEFGTSKEKGTDYVRVLFRIVGGDHNGNELAWDGYFTEKTTQRTIESLRLCGCTFPHHDVTNLEGIDENEVSITVEHEEYTDKNGDFKTSVKIAWVNRLGGPAGIKAEQQMDTARKAAFRDRMRGAVVASGQPVTGAPRAPQAPKPKPAAPPARQTTNREPPPDFDDIPF